MFRTILRSRLASIGLASVIAVGVIGTAGVALADDPGSGPPPAGAQGDGPGGLRHAKHHIVKLTLADIIKHSGLGKDVFAQGFKDGKTINEILEENGQDPEAIEAAVLADLDSRLDEAVANGKITQEQADKAYAKAQEALPRFMSEVHKGPGQGKGPGSGKGHPGPGLIAKGLVKSAADAIGIEVQELVQALKAGDSVADVARDNNVDPQTVIDTMIADATARIDQALANGKITQEQADKMKSGLTGRITSFVNKTHQGPGNPGHRGAPPPPAN